MFFFVRYRSHFTLAACATSVINENKSALIRFNQLLSEQNMSDFAVPSIFFCDSSWVGFAMQKQQEKIFLHAMNYCKQQIEKKENYTSVTVNVLRRWANANQFDSGMMENPGGS